MCVCVLLYDHLLVLIALPQHSSTCSFRLRERIRLGVRGTFDSLALRAPSSNTSMCCHPPHPPLLELNYTLTVS